MAFQTTTATPSSYTNLSNVATDIHRNKSSTTLAATLGNGAGPWGIKTSSIWRNASLTTPFVPKGLTPDGGDVKRGSGSLLASSESDTPSWRSSTTRPVDSTIRLNTNAAQPFRNVGSVDLTRQNISPTTTRTPAVNLTNATFPQSRPSFGSSQTSGMYGNGPPVVYPKYKGGGPRPSVDTLASPSSTTASPLSERRPPWPAQYSSGHTSRDTSRAPTSSHSDSHFNFNDYSQRSAYTKRTSSISSQQGNGPCLGGMSSVNPEYLPAAFSQLSLAAQDRPMPRTHSQQTYPQLETYADPPCFVNDEETDSYALTRFNAAYGISGQPQYSSVRLCQDHRITEFRSSHPFNPTEQHARLQQEMNMMQKQTALWQELSKNSGMTRSPTPHSTTPFDARYTDTINMKDQYLLNQYALPHVQTIPPYLGYYNLALNPINGGLAPSTPPADFVEGVQSAKLYDFKLAGKNNRRYELKDIYEHIAEFAGDQHGSRFIQTKLETANSEEKDRVFREIEPNAIPLMTDVFGNYVIQKFFDHGHQEHKKILANKMRGQVLNLSTQMYGCRVVQKALEHVLCEQQASLVGELEHHVLKCVKDQNGNHVIQKAIERCPPDTIAFVYQAFVGQVHSLSLHPYGCRVIQRCLERTDNFPQKNDMLEELHEGMPKGMIGDSYGNYVVQHVVENGPEKDRQHVLGIVLSDLEGYSKHKFASNVVEKCIQYSDDAWRRRVVEILTTVDERRAEGEGVLVGLIKDSFGNYVIQKLLDNLAPSDFIYFHQHLQPAMAYTKRIGSGKQVVSIEKKMQKFEDLVGRTMAAAPVFKPAAVNGTSTSFQHHQHQHHQQELSSRSPPGYRYDPHASRGPQCPLSIPSHAYASMYGSVSNTPPPLTSDTRSIQSSGVPSVNGDAVEGATSMSRKNSEAPIDNIMLR